MDSLDLLRTFTEVAHRGSCAGAARALDLSKAHVSKYVAALEAQLGVRLFNRSTRNVGLTDAGELLLERSESLIHMARAGLGMVWLPRVLLQTHLDEGTLVAALDGEGSPGDVWLYAAYAQRRHNSAALKAFPAVIESRWRDASTA